MATPLIDPSMARASLDDHQVQSMQRMAESSRKPLDPAAARAKEKKLREACEGFEAVFVQKMWEGMRASLPKDGPMHSRDEQFWQGMYDQELGKSVASSGGIGLADMMMSQLSRNLQNASEVAANATGRSPMPIAPVPLVPGASKSVASAQSGGQKEGNGGAMSDLYSGAAVQPEAPLDALTAEQALAQAGQTTGQGTTGSGVVLNPTPPEIMASLNEFAAQLNPAQTNPANTQTMNPVIAQALNQAAQTVGQQPVGNTVQAVGPVAQALSQAAQTVGQQPVGSRPDPVQAPQNAPPGVVRTTYITNDPQRVTRQNRSAQRVSSGSPVTGRGAARISEKNLSMRAAQNGQATQSVPSEGQNPGQTGQPAVIQTGRPAPLGQPTAMMRATQAAQAEQSTQAAYISQQQPRNQAGQPSRQPRQILQPEQVAQILQTSQMGQLNQMGQLGQIGQMDGVITGSEIASQQSTTQVAGFPQAMRFTTTQQSTTANMPDSLTAMATTGNRR